MKFKNNIPLIILLMAFLSSSVIVYVKYDDPEASVMRDIIMHRSITSLSSASDYVDDNNDGIDDRVASLITASSYDVAHKDIMFMYARKIQEFYEAESITISNIENFGIDLYLGMECLSPLIGLFVTYTELINPGLIHHLYSIMPKNKERFNQFSNFSYELLPVSEDMVLTGLAFKELAANKNCSLIMEVK